ncbi:MAG: ADP-ribosylglycohydrolase family protein [Candidatus Marinimicrobia bacterium]|nr:ADP-ribosylglycohydrolase family protein [Candidatus Neomarinimicrobiota bacterium]
MVALSPDEATDRIAGALFGLAIGDALGADTEGLNPDSIQQKYGWIKGFHSADQFGTDDTEFTLFYAGLLDQYGLDITSETVAKHYLKDIYHPSQTYKGAGFSEALTLQNLLKGLMPPASGQHIHSWSDGLAMCAAPFGCVYPGQPEKATDLAERFGQVSHSGEGIYGGQAVAAAVSMAISGSSIEQMMMAVLDVIPADSWTYNLIKQAVAIGKDAADVRSVIEALYDEIACNYYHWSDLAPEAVGIAFGLLAAGKGDYKNTILGAVNLGRDADTIAAIIGAVLGASRGYQSLPKSWREQIKDPPGLCIRSVAGMSIDQTAKILTKLALAGEEKR